MNNLKIKMIFFNYLSNTNIKKEKSYKILLMIENKEFF